MRNHIMTDYDSIPVRKNSLWKSKTTGGIYKVSHLERSCGLILYIKLTNVNQGGEFEVHPYELHNEYEEIKN